MTLRTFDLDRFVVAQADVYEQALAELAAGRKRGHWMWFVFPQLRGLGASALAHRFGIASRGEAEAFVVHPLLGPRLIECTAAVLDCGLTDAHDIFGPPDDLKFRSSMTLFALVAPGEPLFRRALDVFYGGMLDDRTVALLC